VESFRRAFVDEQVGFGNAENIRRRSTTGEKRLCDGAKPFQEGGGLEPQTAVGGPIRFASGARASRFQTF